MEGIDIRWIPYLIQRVCEGMDIDCEACGETPPRVSIKAWKYESNITLCEPCAKALIERLQEGFDLLEAGNYPE